jgi:hypothetical protein
MGYWLNTAYIEIPSITEAIAHYLAVKIWSIAITYVMKQDVLPTPKHIARCRAGAVMTTQARDFHLFKQLGLLWVIGEMVTP